MNWKTNLRKRSWMEETQVTMETCRQWNRIRFWPGLSPIRRLVCLWLPWPGRHFVLFGWDLSAYLSNPSRTSRSL